MADINIQMKNKIGETWNKLFPKTKISLVEGLPAKLDDVDTRLNAAATKTEVNAKIGVVNEQLADIAQDVAITVTVGTGGNYPTINAALAYLSRKTLKYVNRGLKAEIKLLSGFVMAEQVIISGINLGWIIISSEDATVTINRASLVSRVEFPSYAGSSGAIGMNSAFMGVNNAVLPVINTLFTMNETGASGSYGGVFVINNSSATVMKDCGVRNAGGTTLYAAQTSHIVAMGADASYSKGNALSVFRGSWISFRGGNGSYAGVNGMYADSNSHIEASGANVSHATQAAIWCDSVSSIAIPDGDASYAGTNGIVCNGASNVDADKTILDNAGQRGVSCTDGSTVTVWQSSIKNAGTQGVYAERGGFINATAAVVTGAADRGAYAVNGGRINVQNANCRKGAVDSTSDIVVNNGGEILAIGATGGLNKVANTVTAAGLIIGADVVEQITATLQNGWTGTLYYGKNGQGQVWVRGTIVAGSVTADTIAAVLPGGYRPVGAPFPVLAFANNSVIPAFTISVGGSLQLRTSSITAGMSVDINCTFQT
ncbi:right-handed parallel beta-helix repeat-containing protein [Paenibacillus sp. RS8]|uniref:right-handed parallel beta-helix repeat-containing protein n=1 Tax=Paenibacillus sp. RS8 TaxID=3242681 RepID=UPI0035C0F5BA